MIRRSWAFALVLARAAFASALWAGGGGSHRNTAGSVLPTRTVVSSCVRCCVSPVAPTRSSMISRCSTSRRTRITRARVRVCVWGGDEGRCCSVAHVSVWTTAVRRSASAACDTNVACVIGVMSIVSASFSSSCCSRRSHSIGSPRCDDEGLNPLRRIRLVSIRPWFTWGYVGFSLRSLSRSLRSCQALTPHCALVASWTTAAWSSHSACPGTVDLYELGWGGWWSGIPSR